MSSMIILMMSLILVALPQAVTQQPKASLEGHVTTTSGAPMSGVSVELLNLLGGGNPNVTTDESGRFSFGSLDPGSYMVRVGREGYTVPGSSVLQVGATSVGRVDLPAGQQVRGFQVQMIATGDIIGRVTRTDGIPLAGILIRTNRRVYQDGQWKLAGLNINARTDERGEYRLVSLPPGNYYLLAEVALDTTLSVLPAYFPGTRDYRRAQPVPVKTGEITNIDFVLEPGTFRVNGRVVSPPQTVVSQFRVSVVSRDPSFIPDGPQVSTFDPAASSPGQFFIRSFKALPSLASTTSSSLQLAEIRTISDQRPSLLRMILSMGLSSNSSREWK